SRSSGPWRSQRRPVGSPAETHMAGRATFFPFYGGTESSNSLSSATYDIDLLLLSSREVLRVPARRCSHHLAESLALINLVMAVAFEDDELFRFPGAGVKRFTFGWRDQPIIVRGDEHDRPRRDLVDHPLRIEAQGIVDEFERDCGYRCWVVAAGDHAELGGLTV